MPKGVFQRSAAARAAMVAGQRVRRDRERSKQALVPCEHCAAPFPRRWRNGVKVMGPQRFCSPQCARRARPRQDPGIERLANFMRNCLHRIGVNTAALERLRRHSEVIVGYTKGELRAALEAQFSDGMSWSNYGGTRHRQHGRWVIDHKVPIVNFLKGGVTDPRVINALSNLQPMWSVANTEKRARVAA